MFADGSPPLPQTNGEECYESTHQDHETPTKKSNQNAAQNVIRALFSTSESETSTTMTQERDVEVLIDQPQSTSKPEEDSSTGSNQTALPAPETGNDQLQHMPLPLTTVTDRRHQAALSPAVSNCTLKGPITCELLQYNTHKDKAAMLQGPIKLRLLGNFQCTLEGPLQCQGYDPIVYPFSCKLQGPFHCTLDHQMLYKFTDCSQSPDNARYTLQVLRNDVPQSLLQDDVYQSCDTKLKCTLTGTFQCTLYDPLSIQCKNHGQLTLLPYPVYRCYRITATKQCLSSNEKCLYENRVTIEPRLLFKPLESYPSTVKKGQHFEEYFKEGVERIKTKGLYSKVEFQKELPAVRLSTVIEKRSKCKPDAIFIHGTSRLSGAVVDMKNYTGDSRIDIHQVEKSIKDMSALESYLTQKTGSTITVIGCLYIRRETKVSDKALEMAKGNGVCLVREEIIDADELVNIVDMMLNNGKTKYNGLRL